MDQIAPRRVGIIGAGFAGLSAAFDLAEAGHHVFVLEAAPSLGGLAGSFAVGDTQLEHFYHHWFKSDTSILGLIADLGADDQVVFRSSKTGLYYANSLFRLSSPFDVLRFTPLRFIDRIRMGLLVLQVRNVRDWRALESLTAKEWLIGLAGPEVYRVVWEPLLKGKFGRWAEEISAVWFWKKIALRGGSRSNDGGETLAYFEGGFGRLTTLLAQRITELGGEIRVGSPVTGLKSSGGRVECLVTPSGEVPVDTVIATPALPIIADLLAPHCTTDYEVSLRRIQYLANTCLVLELDRSLSETYWLNVNDPSFPFVGIIEHTNFEPSSSYAGRHIVYLSRYLSEDDPLYAMPAAQVLEFAIPHIARMFPKFASSWVLASHVWRAQYAQPIVVRDYGALIPARRTPLENFFIATMAQIYPEDRGTNYAVREGRAIAKFVSQTNRVG